MPKGKRGQRACDQCNFRRVKCSHDQPCNHCRRYEIDCTYWKASRGIEASGRRIDSLKRLRQSQGGNALDSPGPFFGSNSSSPASSNLPSTSHPNYHNHSQNMEVEPMGSNTISTSYMPRNERQSYPKELDPYNQGSPSGFQNGERRNMQRIHQDTRVELSANPMLDSTSNLANFMESAFSELAPDVAALFRLPNLETPVAETVFNRSTFSERSQFPDFGAFMDLSLSSLPSATPPNPGFIRRPNPTLAASEPPSSNILASLDNSDNSDDESSSFGAESSSLSDSVLIPRVAIFFERLHPIIPVFTRVWLFTRLDKYHQYSDRQFAAMLLAMSSLSLIQPVHASDGSNAKSNAKCAINLLKECIRVRSVPTFGKCPTLDMILTSFYMFACFFGIGEDEAAWFRLREAITLGQILKLHEPSAYEPLDHDERERRLRTYWILAITERAVALQRGHSIGIHGQPSESMKSISQRFNIGELDDFPKSQLRLFDSIDEDFVNCWNGRCAGEKCRKLNTDKALSLNSSFANSQIIESNMASNFDQRGNHATEHSSESNGGSDSRSPWTSKRRRSELQWADVEVTRHWLLNRLWYVCLSHGLIAVDTPHSPLRPDYPITIARDMLVICNDLSLNSMEANGIGFLEKLYDIVRTLVTVHHMFPDQNSDIMKTAGSAHSVRDVDNATRQNQTDISTNAQMHVSHLLAVQMDSTDTTSMQSQPKTTFTHMLSDTRISSSISTGPSQDNNVQPTSPSSQPLPLKYPTVQDIFNGYLSVFRRFRAGDHHFLPKLIGTMRDLSLEINER